MRGPSRSVNTTKPAVAALPLSQNFAKTVETAPDHEELGQTVELHCEIVGKVAQELAALYPEGVRSRWLAGAGIAASLHDIGKVSPTFQEKIRRGTSGYMKNSLPELRGASPELEHQWGGHGGVSLASLLTYPGVDRTLAEIAGSHHGSCPVLGMRKDGDEVFGDKSWQLRRFELIDKLKSYFDESLPNPKDDAHTRVLAGLTSVSDWIGSGQTLSALTSIDSDVIKLVVKNAGFQKISCIPHLTFEQIFGFTPNDTQAAFAQACAGPGIYILESEMGSGKTEAALFAAYCAIARGDATGLYFALPTQATSDAIYLRIQKFLDNIQDRKSPLLLAHSNADLSLSEMGAEASPAGSWFSQLKRRILSNFAIGTVDQALMAVMSVRHGFVRTFGLLGKVVILDEVHSYDLYTGTILTELVKTLRAVGCTVIILSATLSASRRTQLLGAEVSDDAYPLISAVAQSKEAKPIEIPVKASGHKEVTIKNVFNQQDALNEAIARSRSGQQVLWIENTVRDAQERYGEFQKVLKDSGIELGLMHSRFTKKDRTANEQHWVGLYGKKGRSIAKPCGRILIGTQVLEQSLDIDADFLVTKICPTDMLLQRIGRLWRHSNTARAAGSRCEAWIVEPTLSDAQEKPYESFGSTGIVYAPYVLLRTMLAWKDVQTLLLPKDIRSLINATYDEHNDDNVLQRLHQDMKKGRVVHGIKFTGSDDLQNFARLALAKNMSLSDDNACTRFGEVPSVNVLLLKDLTDQKAVLYDGTVIPLEVEHLNTKRNLSWASGVQRSLVRVPAYLAPTPPELSELSWVKNATYLSRNPEECMRFVLVDDQGNCSAVFGSSYQGITASYDNKGYATEKI